MLTIVADCFNASSQMVTVAEKMAAAKTWTRILSDIVPQNRLSDVLDFAFKKHSSSFAINAYDLKLRWEELQAEESTERERIATEEKTLNRVAHCPEKHNHKSPDEAIQNYFVSGKWEWMPCVHCRTEAYWQRVKIIKENNLAEKSNQAHLEEMISEKVEGDNLAPTNVLNFRK